MSSGLTSRGIARVFDVAARAATAPGGFFMALVTTAVAPSRTTKTLGTLTQIAATNGYTNGGIAIPRSNVGFTAITEDDVNFLVDVAVQTFQQAASGGSIGPFRYLVLTEDGGTVSSRNVWGFIDLGQDVTIASGQTKQWPGTKLRVTLSLT